MASTDRERIKDQQEGVYLTTGGMTNAKSAVDQMHCRALSFPKVGTENAETNVAETVMGFVPHKSRAKKFGLMTGTNIESDNTDYLVVKFFKRKAGTSTLIGSWNTHGGAQGAITTAGPAVISSAATGLVTNSDADIAEDSEITYSITKVAAGKAVAQYSIFSAWLEEI